MAKIESRIGTINTNESKIFDFVSDFTNFKNVIPADQVSDFEASKDECSFQLPGMGKAGMKIIEREPFKLVKIESTEKTPLKFQLWIQLKSVSNEETRVKVTIDPEINQLMASMVKGPLKKFVDQMVDQMEKFNY